MEKLSIAVNRHLDDINDLERFGRDSELIIGQENEAKQIATQLIEDIKNENKSAIVFVCSNKKRGIQTADLVSNEIKKIDNEIKIRISSENRLSSIYEGEFILPLEYKAGELFKGLPLANKAFNNETFNFDLPNDLYKFGDPFLQQDGSYKYPELLPYFKSYGESNKDFMIRIYDIVIETYEKIDKLNLKTKVVAITHAQCYQVFKNLIVIAKKIKNENIKFKTGSIPRLCWELYTERSKQKQTYETNFIPIEELYDPEIIELLKEELEYLNNLK